uniref:Phlebovirus_G2 domain-containing protein n=1 Tax=Heligmosomoides polygyrus TaxID=6339 RepID=A0A183G5M3_HELPZ
LMSNDYVTEIRLLWKTFQLICEKDTILYTRSMIYNLLDSKRCPHARSCTNDKCGSINRSLLPELRNANHFPGVTGCKAGGPGCDCFYPSSGCLFCRIYLVPNNDDIYEFYKCARWKETVQLLLIQIDAHLEEERAAKEEVKSHSNLMRRLEEVLTDLWVAIEDL